jgi:hypothetical protein
MPATTTATTVTGGILRSARKFSTHRIGWMSLFACAAWAAAAPQAYANLGPSLAPSGWDASIKLAEAIDQNPDPRIVEIELIARGGRRATSTSAPRRPIRHTSRCPDRDAPATLEVR